MKQNPIASGERIFVAGKTFPVRWCRWCDSFKTALPTEKKIKDPRRQFVDENGKSWLGHRCPECDVVVRHDQYRAWLERKALRRGRPIPGHRPTARYLSLTAEGGVA